MAQFSLAIGRTLEHEGFGRYTDDPADPGGATKWGISLRFLRESYPELDLDGDGDLDEDDVKRLSRAKAIELYRFSFWDRNGYSALLSQPVAAKLFDLTVNMGPRQSHRIAQRALNATGCDLVDDGILGPLTMRALNSTAADSLLPAIRSEAAGVYRILVAQKPAFSRFINGWLRRAYS